MYIILVDNYLQMCILKLIYTKYIYMYAYTCTHETVSALKSIYEIMYDEH